MCRVLVLFSEREREREREEIPTSDPAEKMSGGDLGTFVLNSND
jgi:hypothetical protein